MARLRLPRLNIRDVLVDTQGRPTTAFQRWWQSVVTAIETFVNSLADIVDAIQAAQDAADAANAAAAVASDAATAAQGAADSVTSDTSLSASGIENVVTPPLMSADSAGAITISTHDRRYGNSALNPTVTVSGAVVASGAAPADVVYVYYDDPSRAGGAVTYLTSLDPTDAVQTGNRHSVGVVEIPGSGSSDGNFMRPPGVLVP